MRPSHDICVSFSTPSFFSPFFFFEWFVVLCVGLFCVCGFVVVVVVVLSPLLFFLLCTVLTTNITILSPEKIGIWYFIDLDLPLWMDILNVLVRVHPF